MKWSRNYKSCLQCDTTTIKHMARGLCSGCYFLRYYEENKKRIKERIQGNYESNRGKRRNYEHEYYLKHRTRINERTKKWRSENYSRVSAKVRENKLLNKYGISTEIFEQILREQKSLCAICGSIVTREAKNACIDHCHVSGRVRGILCHSCNKGLGHFRDNAEILRKAHEYILLSK